MPAQTIDKPDSIIPRKAGALPGEGAEKGLITLPGESEREVDDLAGSYITTKLDQVVNWARGNSLWPLPFGTACCAIEFMSMVSSHYDIARREDRKSTRLNSSHSQISYAVFCLKKKKDKNLNVTNKDFRAVSNA